MDEEVLKGIGAAQQLQKIIGTPPEELVELLKRGPAQHLQNHAYQYRRKFDVELASIRRLKELQVCLCRASCYRVLMSMRLLPECLQSQLRVVALVGTVLVAALVGVANYVSRVIYESVHGGE
jgi:hypothetical protein